MGKLDGWEGGMYRRSTVEISGRAPVVSVQAVSSLGRRKWPGAIGSNLLGPLGGEVNRYGSEKRGTTQPTWPRKAEETSHRQEREKAAERRSEGSILCSNSSAPFAFEPRAKSVVCAGGKASGDSTDKDDGDEQQSLLVLPVPRSRLPRLAGGQARLIEW